MEKTKLNFLLIFATALIFITAGCGKKQADNNAETTEVKIGMCFYTDDGAYISSVRKAIEDEAGNSNIKLILNDSNNSQETQNEQIDAMIEEGVDALAINIVDINEAPAVIAKAEAAGLPIVFFNREPATDAIKAYDKARFVGTIVEDAGIIQGELIVNIWQSGHWDKNGDGKIQYVMLMGDIGNPEAIARTEYSVSTVLENGIGVEELGETEANWDYDKAKAAMQSWQESPGYGSIEFVISNNDSMAAGAISALQRAGYNKGDINKYIPVVGVDATEEAVGLIMGGNMSGTVKQDAVAMGQTVIALAKNAALGNDFLAGTTYKYDNTGIAVRMPYSPYTGR